MSSLTEEPTSVGFAPGRTPVFGHALKLRFRPLEFLEAQRDRGDIVVFWIGPSRAYMVNNPPLIRQLLTTHRGDFPKGGPLADVIRVLMGDGLATADADLHRKQRRLIQPAFHPSRFPTYVAVMQKAATAKATSWHDKQVITVDHEMHELATTILGRCIYSGSLSGEAIDEIAYWLPVAFD
ncbi:MAG: cytochrome P450, partial [Pseudonocardiaceae bacterium]